MSRLLDPVLFYRIARWLYCRNIPVLPRVLEGLSVVVFHCEIPYVTKIGSNLQLAHHAFGLVIHPRAVLGDNVVISPGVVIGGINCRSEVPRIGNNVYVGPGAKILGDVVVGECAVIGANAVVLYFIPPCSVAVGIPARIIRTDIDPFEYSGWPSHLFAIRYPG